MNCAYSIDFVNYNGCRSLRLIARNGRASLVVMVDKLSVERFSACDLSDELYQSFGSGMPIRH